LQYYLDNANDASRTAKYSPFLGSLNSAVVHYGIDASDDVSSTWYAANQGGGPFTAQSGASGLAALVSAAKVSAMVEYLQNVPLMSSFSSQRSMALVEITRLFP
jgi:hypothetical protein